MTNHQLRSWLRANGYLDSSPVNGMEAAAKRYTDQDAICTELRRDPVIMKLILDKIAA